ncbi:MAG: histidine kinase, partial [Chitinophagaceae bacterium]|nr:histidine kinase [Rubrivivax sp.]
MTALRQAFAAALTRSFEQRARARQENLDALCLNRAVSAALTVFSAVALWLFVRLRSRTDDQAAQQQARLEGQVQARTADLREPNDHLQTAREDERSHLAREMHDEMGGFLSALKLDVVRLRKTPDMPPGALDKAAQIGQRLDQVIALKRRVIEDLHPSALDMLGLKISLEILCREAADDLGIPVRTELHEVDLPAPARLTVYRLVQESLTNIRKYAQAREVAVRLLHQGNTAQVEVRDDGRGFDP